MRTSSLRIETTSICPPTFIKPARVPRNLLRRAERHTSIPVPACIKHLFSRLLAFARYTNVSRRRVRTTPHLRSLHLLLVQHPPWPLATRRSSPALQLPGLPGESARFRLVCRQTLQIRCHHHRHHHTLLAHPGWITLSSANSPPAMVATC